MPNFRRVFLYLLPLPLFALAACSGSDGGGASDGSRPLDAHGPDAPQLTDGTAERDNECTKDQDCLLVNDCCHCVAIASREEAPYCDPHIACLVSSCTQYPGIDKARCARGRCVLGFNCDASTVSTTGCSMNKAPTCPRGQVPRVVVMGSFRCYGECVDENQCMPGK